MRFLWEVFMRFIWEVFMKEIHRAWFQPRSWPRLVMASGLVWSLLGCRPRVSSSWEPDKPGTRDSWEPDKPGTRACPPRGDQLRTIPADHPELGTRQARDSGHAHLKVTNLGTIFWIGLVWSGRDPSQDRSSMLSLGTGSAAGMSIPDSREGRRRRA
jgi:hypothetical protein